MTGEIGFDVPELVVGGLKSFGMSANEDASVPILRWFFMTNGVLTKHQIVMVAANKNGGSVVLASGFIVQDDVTLEAVAMSACFRGFFAKFDSVFGVGNDTIAEKRVVRAPATDRDAWAGVFQQLVVLETATLDGDAYE